MEWGLSEMIFSINFATIVSEYCMTSCLFSAMAAIEYSFKCGLVAFFCGTKMSLDISIHLKVVKSKLYRI